MFCAYICLCFSGKTKVVDLLCTLANRSCVVDTIDDSVTGSFQQVDFNRHLEEISQLVESILMKSLQNYALTINCENLVKLMNAWEIYNQLLDASNGKCFCFSLLCDCDWLKFW